MLVTCAVTKSNRPAVLIRRAEVTERIFQKGIDIDLKGIYPSVEFPVSRGTAMISPLIKWNHEVSYLVPWFDTFSYYERRKIAINLSDKEFEYIKGHVIDGRVLVPAATWIFLVWETFGMMNAIYHEKFPVIFEDIKLLRATSLKKNQDVIVTVNIQRGTGRFEIIEGASAIVNGFIKMAPNMKMTEISEPSDDVDGAVVVSEEDFFQEMRTRGYFYSGYFRGVYELRDDYLRAKIKWRDNWITFIDAMTFCDLSTSATRDLVVPTDIRKLTINPKIHYEILEKLDENHEKAKIVDVIVCPYLKIIKAGGVEICEKITRKLTRRRPREALLEVHEFVPFFPHEIFSNEDAAKLATQLILEDFPKRSLKSVEIDDEIFGNPISSSIVKAVADLPSVVPDVTLLTLRKIEAENVIIDSEKEFTSFRDVDILIKSGCTLDEDFLEEASSILSESGCIIAREKTEIEVSHSLFELVARILIDTEIFHILRVKKLVVTPKKVVKITPDHNEWLTHLQDSLKDGNVLLYSQGDSSSGILGLVNCLRREFSGKLKCFFIDDKTALPFDIEVPFYKQQIAINHSINVFKNGKWGSYRHLQLQQEKAAKPQNDHCIAECPIKGDLSSIVWLQGHLSSSNQKLKNSQIKIQYASLNFKDVMLSLGTLQSSEELGFEFGGVDSDGKRIMGIARKGSAMATFYDSSHLIQWNVPDKWTLEDAATVPVVYFTVYFAFFVTTEIKRGQSILIHAGSGGVGQAAIQVAFAYGLEVFTTVSTDEKKNFLLEKFPQLKAENIGNSRDTTFERTVLCSTKGRGVDYVLNSLSEEKLQASIRCLANNGTFLEIGKFDIANRSNIHLGHFSKRIQFKAVFVEDLETHSDDMLKVHKLVEKDIKAGIVQPLSRKVFKASEAESAFRFMASGKHIGKVILKMRENATDIESLPLRVLPRVCCNPEESYIIVGGLGGFGIELAYWLIDRGCRKLILSSRKGITKNVQLARIRHWQKTSAVIIVSTSDASTESGCEKLLKEANELGPVAGIFNLAVVLKDAIFENQTVESFSESLKPKADATKFLDELSRKLCRSLKHFVVFSSVSCGRGNAGQSNYGLANSVMERIVEKRKNIGLPGKAIQWGAIAAVGLLADAHAENGEIEVDGTLAQEVRSCMDVLDSLLTVPEPIVSSLVVADKQATTASKGNIVEAILNIMALRDRKLISMYSTLARLGIDSLMGVEIRQVLEREFGVVMTSQELRSLNLNQLERKVKSKENEAIVVESQKLPLEKLILMNDFGSEATSNEILIKINVSREEGMKILVIPGMLGLSNVLYLKTVEELEFPAYILQTHSSAECTTIDEIVDSVANEVLKLFDDVERFYFIAHSFGATVALKLASVLESKGKSGKISFIDGSPEFVGKVANDIISDIRSDDDESLRERILKNIIASLFAESSEDVETKVFEKKSWESRIENVHELLGSVEFSEKHMKKALLSMFNRLKVSVNIREDFQLPPLKNTTATLVKSYESLPIESSEDYGLNKFFEKPLDVEVLLGGHFSLLKEPMLPKLLKALL